MPQLREAYEAYFDEALDRAYEDGFRSAFARAASARNVEKFSNVYIDLGFVAKNTKSIMPKTSKKLLHAIDKAVIYNKRGDALKGKGLSTYYPLTSSENLLTNDKDESGKALFDLIEKQNSNYVAQKEFYGKLLSLDIGTINNKPAPLELKDGHLVANLTPCGVEGISSYKCILFPLNA